MISFESFIIADGSPIYHQIIRHIKRGIAGNIVNSGDEMPSRRVLSALLGVNPNTVQKAYRILEDEGIIESRSGAKSFVTFSEDVRSNIKHELVRGEVLTMITAMKQTGVSKKEAIALMEQLWDLEEII